MLTDPRYKVIYEYPEAELELAWRACLANGDIPTHYSAPEFFLEPMAAGEKRFAVLALDPQGPVLRVTGSLTGVIAADSIRSGQIGTPQICLDSSEDPQAVGSALEEGLRVAAESVGLVTLYSWFPIDAFTRAGYHESVESGTAALDLSSGPEKTFSRLKGRSQIRHAISAGVEVRQAASEDLPDYYAILKGWSERKELPCPTLDFLQKSVAIRQSRRLFLALHEGKIIAGTPVRFYPRATAEYAWNASLPDFQHLRPNDLLHWRIIEWACQEGIHTYLLGATHAFLLKYSDRIIPTHKYVKDRTLFRTHMLKGSIEGAAVDLYRSLPAGVKEKIKRLRHTK